MNKAFLAAVCLVLMTMSIGCNTIRGFGEDVKTVGGWVTRGVDNVQEKN